MSKPVTVRPDTPVDTLQHLPYFIGISGKTAGSQGLSMHLVVIPPGGQSSPHLHVDHETAIYMIQGVVETFYGEQLEHSEINRAGDFLFIPPGLPHLARNLSETESALAVVARNDSGEQEKVCPWPWPASGQ